MMKPKPSSARSGISHPDGAWGFVAGGATKILLRMEYLHARATSPSYSFKNDLRVPIQIFSSL